MVLKTFKRYELKYLINEEEFEAINHILKKKMDYDAYCLGGSRYNIYNVYYDTGDDLVIRHSLDKPYYKEKLRLRAYDIPNSKSKVFIELKKKIGGIVNKRRTVMEYDKALKFIENPVIIAKNSLDKQVMEEIKFHLERYNLKAKVFIRYERLAYFAKDDSDFRVSFDSNIMTRRYDVELHKGDFGEELIGADEYLMEIKCKGGVPLWFSSLLSELKVYKTSFSKYGNEYKKYLKGMATENKEDFSLAI